MSFLAFFSPFTKGVFVMIFVGLALLLFGLIMVILGWLKPET
jgi:uncharacterized membrane protein HdeD (DUF308 family)